ncbi:MAG TPA: hypothetical protein PLM37_08265, partial [Elusimicrobiota bacterium]|nr:hypothetical protein [Elusimicrobiota bacterium]
IYCAFYGFDDFLDFSSKTPQFAQVFAKNFNGYLRPYPAEQMIEAVHEENVVRRVTFKKKLGEAKSTLRPGQTAGGYVVTFGRLIPR